jgi:hypothetical protein
MKALLDWVTGGTVLFKGTPVTFVTKYLNKRISNGSGSVPVGELEDALSTNAHTNEFAISKDGESYYVTFYNSAAENNYAVAYYDGSGTFINGILGGNPVGQRETKTVLITPPNGTRIVRAFSLSTEAALVPVKQDAKYEAIEMRVKPVGQSVSQIVWPTETTVRVMQETVIDVWYDRNNDVHADGYNYGDMLCSDGDHYAYARGKFEWLIGDTVISSSQDWEVLNIVSVSRMDTVTIGSQTMDAFYKNGNRMYGRYLSVYPNSASSCSIKVEKYGIKATVYVNQLGNQIERVITRDGSTVGYRAELSDYVIDSSGGDTTIYGYKQYEVLEQDEWTSGARGPQRSTIAEVSDNPTYRNIEVTPDNGDIGISGNVVTFPQNTGANDKEYNIAVTKYSDTENLPVTVLGTDSGHTYSNLNVDISYTNLGTSQNPYHVLASGTGLSGIYGTVTVSLYVDGYQYTGSVNNGATTCVVSRGGNSTTVMLSYEGSANGNIYAESRGKVPGDKLELARVRVTATKGTSSGTLTNNSAFVRVYQQENIETITPGTFSVSNIDIDTGFTNNYINTANDTEVNIIGYVTGSGTTPAYSYTSGASTPSEQKTMNHEETPVSVKVDSVLTPSRQFTASNKYVETQKTYTIEASYNNSSWYSTTLTQKADAKINDSGEPTATIAIQSGTNNVWAGGGDVYVEGRAFTNAGKKWESDGTPVPNESSTIWNTSRLTIEQSQTNSGAYTVEYINTVTSSNDEYKLYKVSHRDMENNETTDTITLNAKNGTVTSNPIHITTTNSIIDEILEDVAWGQTYDGYQNCSVSFSLDSNTPVSFAGGSVGFTATANYETRPLRDGTFYTYKKYTSWSETNNSNTHILIVNPNTHTVTGQPVPNSSWTSGSMDATVTSAEVWCVVDSQNKLFILSVQSAAENNDARSCTVTARHPKDLSIYQQLTVQQEGYKELTVSPTSIIFESEGGNQTFVVTWRRTAWNITHQGEGNAAFTSISPLSGGNSVNSLGETTITVTASPYFGDVNIFETITVSPSPNDSNLGDATVDVYQKTPTVISDYTGTVNAIWTSSNTISYQVHITSLGRGKTFNGAEVIIRTTNKLPEDQTPEIPEEGPQIGRIALPSFSVVGNTTTLVASGTYTFDHNEDTSLIYWINVYHIDIHSNYSEIDHSV